MAFEVCSCCDDYILCPDDPNSYMVKNVAYTQLSRTTCPKK